MIFDEWGRLEASPTKRLLFQQCCGFRRKLLHLAEYRGAFRHGVAVAVDADAQRVAGLDHRRGNAVAVGACGSDDVEAGPLAIFYVADEVDPRFNAGRDNRRPLSYLVGGITLVNLHPCASRRDVENLGHRRGH